jgi:hypothetical protein
MAHRWIAIVALFGAGLGLGLVGCKSGGGSGGSGGSGGAPDDAPVVLPPNSNGQSCQQSGGTCEDQAAIQEYADCVVTTCDAEYKQCFGADYMNGTFGGDCGDLMDCASACQDCDQACIDACSEQHFTDACKSCITGPILDCVIDALTSGTCALPCGPSNSGGVCDDLKACCDSLTGDDQTNCQSTYDQVKIGGDAACQTALSTYQQSQKCL